MTIRQSANPRLILQGSREPQPGEARTPIPIDHLPFTLGRSSDRDLCIPSPEISRAHALIDRDADGYFIRDTGSRHGTYVNGIRITTTRLRSQDVIALGTPDHSLVFDAVERENSTKSILAQFSQVGLKAISASGAASDLETLTLFLKAAQSLQQHGVRADVLSTMLEYTIRLTGAERGFVFLGNSAENLKFECGRELDGTPIVTPTSISQSILRNAANSKLAFLFSDSLEDAAVGRETMVLNAIRNVVSIPLRSQNSALLGLLYLDTRATTHDFTRTRRDILEAIAVQTATLFENLRMLEAEREFALLRKELEIAAAIQRQIIPQHLPQFPFVRLDARSIPCTGVGGDFYDVIPVTNGFAAIVGDVCGKGIPAALLGSMVQGMFHAQMTAGAELTDAIKSLNTFICKRAPGEKYLTLAALRYYATGKDDVQVELVNGGHVSPLVVRANGDVETITDGDPPVGLFDFAQFHAIPVSLGVGDRLLLLTDGITEAENAEGTPFSTAQLDRYIGDPKAVEVLFSALDQFCIGTRPQDDQTILTIDRIEA